MGNNFSPMVDWEALQSNIQTYGPARITPIFNIPGMHLYGAAPTYTMKSIHTKGGRYNHHSALVGSYMEKKPFIVTEEGGIFNTEVTIDEVQAVMELSLEYICAELDKNVNKFIDQIPGIAIPLVFTHSSNSDTIMLGIKNEMEIIVSVHEGIIEAGALYMLVYYEGNFTLVPSNYTRVTLCQICATLQGLDYVRAYGIYGKRYTNWVYQLGSPNTAPDATTMIKLYIKDYKLKFIKQYDSLEKLEKEVPVQFRNIYDAYVIDNTLYVCELDSEGNLVFNDQDVSNMGEYRKLFKRDISITFVECSEEADYSNKSVDIPNFNLTKYHPFYVYFIHGNTHDAPKLAVTGTPAKEIWYQGTQVGEKRQIIHKENIWKLEYNSEDDRYELLANDSMVFDRGWTTKSQLRRWLRNFDIYDVNGYDVYDKRYHVPEYAIGY